MSQTIYGTSPCYRDNIPSDANRYAKLESIGGKSVVFNQLCDYATVTGTIGGVVFTDLSNHKMSLVGTATSSAQVYARRLNLLANHKYLAIFNYTNFPTSTSTTTKAFQGYDEINATQYFEASDSSLSGTSGIKPFFFTANETTSGFILRFRIQSGNTYNMTFCTPMLYDLTMMFGSGHEPTTVEAFRSEFPLDYYAYNVGEVWHGKLDKVVSYNSDNTVRSETNIPLAIRQIDGYGYGINGIVNTCDFVGEKLHKRIARVDLGSLDFTHNGSFWRAQFPSDAKLPGSNSIPINAICGEYTVIKADGNIILQNPDSFAVLTSGQIRLFNNSSTTRPSGYAYYELATEQEVDISPYVLQDLTIDTAQGGYVVLHQESDTRFLLDNAIKYEVGRRKDANSPIWLVGSVYVPTPSTYEFIREDVSEPDAGRTLDALMHKKTITQKVSISLAWQNVSTEDASEVLTAFENSEYFNVEYLDPKVGDYVTKTFYVGNRNAPLYNCKLNVWSNISFKIVER